MQQVEFHVVIPARYASTRFPGKALAELDGKMIIQHVYERARASRASEVIVATDNVQIAEVCRHFGAQVAETRSDHESGTDRVAEVARKKGWPADSIVVNVQGDSPFIPPASIDQAADLLAKFESAAIATLCEKITDPASYRDANVVKVVCDEFGRALYFSRASIPALAHDIDQETKVKMPDAWRHIGLYAYRVSALERLTNADSCYLEKWEKLEQLRALWLGMEIRVAIAMEEHGPDVDTPEDLETAARFVGR